MYANQKMIRKQSKAFSLCTTKKNDINYNHGQKMEKGCSLRRWVVVPAMGSRSCNRDWGLRPFFTRGSFFAHQSHASLGLQVSSSVWVLGGQKGKKQQKKWSKNGAGAVVVRTLGWNEGWWGLFFYASLGAKISTRVRGSGGRKWNTNWQKWSKYDVEVLVHDMEHAGWGIVFLLLSFTQMGPTISILLLGLRGRKANRNLQNGQTMGFRWSFVLSGFTFSPIVAQGLRGSFFCIFGGLDQHPLLGSRVSKREHKSAKMANDGVGVVVSAQRNRAMTRSSAMGRQSKNGPKVATWVSGLRRWSGDYGVFE